MLWREYLLLAILNEAFKTAPPICGSGLSTQTNRNGSENGTFSTAIVTNDEINKRTQPNCKKVVAHEVGHSDGFDDAIIGWRIIGNGQRLLPSDELCSLFYKFFFIRDLLRDVAVLVSAIEGYPLFLPLHVL